MASDRHCEGISGAGGRYRSRTVRHADLTSNRSIGAALARRNRREGVPDTALESAASDIEGEAACVCIPIDDRYHVAKASSEPDVVAFEFCVRKVATKCSQNGRFVVAEFDRADTLRALREKYRAER